MCDDGCQKMQNADAHLDHTSLMHRHEDGDDRKQGNRTAADGIGRRKHGLIVDECQWAWIQTLHFAEIMRHIVAILIFQLFESLNLFRWTEQKYR